MKRIIALAFVIMLTACERETVDIAHRYVIPPEFSECTFKSMRNDAGGSITAVRCPNSATAAIQSDKARTTTIVVDGVTYSKIGE